MSKIVTSIMTAAGLTVCGLSFAAAPTITPCVPATSQWYVGAGLNYNAIIDEKAITSLQDPVVIQKLDDHNWGFNLFAGQRLTPRFAHELGFARIGDVEYKFEVNGDPEELEIFKFEVEDIYHIYYDGLFYIPIHPNFEVFAQGGLSYLWQKDHIKEVYRECDDLKDDHEDMFSVSSDLDTFALNLGAGVQVNWNQFALRGRYVRIIPPHDADDRHEIIDTVSVEALWHFA